jgi:hypothetical protein
MSKENIVEQKRYHLNAEGPFYVEDGECLSCMMPEYVAPELMGYDAERAHCYFKRQPSTPEELEHAIEAVASSDIEALRYAGEDPYVLERLSPYVCDALSCKLNGRRSGEGTDSVETGKGD